MKKRIFLMLARVLVLTNLLGVFAFTMVGHAANISISGFRDIPMQYFDEEYTAKQAGQPLSPLVFLGGYGCDTYVDVNTRQLGMFGRAADDASFLMKSKSTQAVSGDYAGNILNTQADSYTFDSNNQTMVISCDMATSSTNGGVARGLQFRMTGAAGANKWPNIIGFRSDGKFMFSSVAAETDAANNGFTSYQTNRWYNFTLVIYGMTNRYDVYIDGVKAVNNQRLLIVSTDPGDGAITISQLRSTIKTVAGVDVDLYMDNFVIYHDNRNFSIEQYNANADAAALSFVSHMRNANVDAANVVSNLTLPATGTLKNSTITWSSDKPSVIAENGTVTPGKTSQVVHLTATITNGADAAAKSTTKKFTVTVPAYLNITNKALTINDAAFNGATTYVQGDVVKVSADIANLVTGTQNTNFVIAAYKNTELVGVAFVPKPITDADTSAHNVFATYVLPAGDYTGVTFKGMIWDDNLEPYCNPIQ